MSDWPIGISTGCFYQRSIFGCLEQVRDAGFTILEICSFPAHLDYRDLPLVKRAAQRIRELQLEPYSFHAPFADHIDITSGDPAVRGPAVVAVEQAAAAELGARYFVIHPGPERSPISGEERLQRMETAAESLNYLARRCRELGTALVLENMLPHLFFGHAKDVLWILGAINACDVGICLDTGHAYLSGDLATVVHKLSGHLWMIHASDNRGNRDDHLPPGEGSIDWQPLVAQLSRLRFEGGVILEIAADASGNVDLAAAQRSRKFLHELAGRRELVERFAPA
ncbi:sugar phosphate isomerase/epimerase family protein [Lacipirellula limnantheis]|uniref:Endonuclease IV n=1 Tax=Lacipirellula limnantheis TaxID=2528024 RepID=A0A517TSS4_9BACT|nr:sugar phosphate isomerase/epimerase [Lacipirellula limnantheis]QDT71425.1 endonuclease IV [Lacipirellula limnantheis]